MNQVLYISESYLSICLIPKSQPVVVAGFLLVLLGFCGCLVLLNNAHCKYAKTVSYMVEIYPKENLSVLH